MDEPVIVKPTTSRSSSSTMTTSRTTSRIPVTKTDAPAPKTQADIMRHRDVAMSRGDWMMVAISERAMEGALVLLGTLRQLVRVSPEGYLQIIKMTQEQARTKLGMTRFPSAPNPREEESYDVEISTNDGSPVPTAPSPVLPPTAPRRHPR
jgi:hypothetical protein